MARKAFREPKIEQIAAKVCLYGPPGSGKTFTALLLAEGLTKGTGKKVAFVDTESGTQFYGSAIPERRPHPEAFDFARLDSRSIVDIVDSVEGLDPKKWGCVVVDSMTHVWEACMDSYRGKRTSQGGIPMHAWGKIKRPIKRLVNHMMNSPMHFIMCARQKNVFAEDEDGELRQVGVAARTEGEIPYEPHVLIRMEQGETRRGHPPEVIAVVEKDRSGLLSGKVIPLPHDQEEGHTFKVLGMPLLSVLVGSSQAQLEDPDDAAQRDADAMTEKELKAEATSTELVRIFTGRLQAAGTQDEIDQVNEEIKKQKPSVLPEHLTQLRREWSQAIARVR